jgi:hypothetical protein
MRSTDRRSPSRSLRAYPSLASFYSADPRRISSRERDVGLWWRDALDAPLHRAAWVSDTGELYLVRLGPAEQGGGAVEVLAEGAAEQQLEAVLEGWREHCGEPRSLSWLRGRARRIGRRPGWRAVGIAQGAASG